MLQGLDLIHKTMFLTSNLDVSTGIWLRLLKYDSGGYEVIYGTNPSRNFPLSLYSMPHSCDRIIIRTINFINVFHEITPALFRICLFRRAHHTKTERNGNHHIKTERNENSEIREIWVAWWL